MKFAIQLPFSCYQFCCILFRERVTLLTTFSEKSSKQVTDTEILGFYNLATSKLLTALEVRLLLFSILKSMSITN